MSLKKQTIAGLIWSTGQQFGNQGITFLVTMILARVLTPAEFGLIGMITVFIGIGISLMDSGLTQSLIRTHHPDQDDYSTVFFFNLLGSAVIYLTIYLLSPYIADFYNQPILKNVTRLYSVTFVISAFSAVQYARLTKLMDFKTQLVVEIPSLIIASIIGIYMAYNGYGVWSLVWSAIINKFFATIQLWFYAKWTPSWTFSKSKFKEHFGFGYKLTLSGLIDTVFNNIYNIVIGKYFSTTQLGYYTQADKITMLPVANISGALSKVTYPLFAAIQDDDVRLKMVYQRIMQMMVFIIAPTLFILMALAIPTFRLLLGPKWIPAAPYFQIICFTGILYPIHVYNLNILKVKGLTNRVLRLEVLKKLVTILAISVSFWFGIYGLLVSMVVGSIIAFFINTYYSGKLLNYNSWQQLSDILPIIFLGLLVGISVYILDYFLLYHLTDILRISIGGVVGASLYLGLAHIFKSATLQELKNLIYKK